MPKLLNQFRSFYIRNYPDTMEMQIEYFAIFGGLGWEIDTTKPLEYLIKTLILENFSTLNNKINELTLNDKNNKKLLRTLAIGDRRIFSAFNKAGLNNGNGGSALNYLQEKGLVTLEYSREKQSIVKHRISHKVIFTHPFIRFWFYFIVPHTKDILLGEYDKLFKDIKLKQNSYTSFIFEELSEILLNYHIRDSQVLSSGSYWNANIEIDILTITDKEDIFVGECKWTNHQINKSEWHKLKDKCKKLNIKPAQIALFSKRGFSKELIQNQSKDLALYSSDDFQVLLKNISKDELLEELI